MRHMERKKIDRNVLALGLTSFFNDWSSEMIFPLLPAFMAEILGIPKVIIGLIEGFSEGLVSVMQVFSGYVSDRIRRRKSLAVVGYAVSNIAKPFLAIAHGWPLVFTVRAADRLGKGIRTAPRDALIAATTEEKTDRGRSFGFHRAMDTSGAIVGTLCAFLLMRFLPGTPYRTIFLLAVIPGIVSVISVAAGTKEKVVGRGAARKASLSWNLLPANLRRLITASVIFGIGNFTFTFFLLRARDMGVSAILIPLIYLIYNVVYAAGAYPAGILSDRLGRKPILVLGFAVYVVTALGFAIFNIPLMAWFLMGLLGLHMALTDATARALVSDLAPEEIRGTALGVYHTGVGIADLPAGLLAGFLWDTISPSAVFFTGAGLTTVALAILFTVKNRSIKAN